MTDGNDPQGRALFAWYRFPRDDEADEHGIYPCVRSSQSYNPHDEDQLCQIYRRIDFAYLSRSSDSVNMYLGHVREFESLGSRAGCTLRQLCAQNNLFEAVQTPTMDRGVFLKAEPLQLDHVELAEGAAEAKLRRDFNVFAAIHDVRHLATSPPF